MLIFFYYKDLFTHKDINTHINGIVKICLNKFFWKYRFPKEKRKNMQNYAKLLGLENLSLR